MNDKAQAIIDYIEARLEEIATEDTSRPGYTARMTVSEAQVQRRRAADRLHFVMDESTEEHDAIGS